MSRSKKFALYLIGAIAIPFFLLYGYMLSNVWSLELQTKSYLIRQGYSEDQLLKVKGFIGKQPVYRVDVVFKDEPTVIYHYVSREYYSIIPSYGVSKILQTGIQLDTPSKKDYKHLEPETRKQLFYLFN
ncbi:hypothetical protein J2T17_004336 [Paenibacillus mucilaginosus]|uniref:DUF3139 domain-containing protein n=1 Tax=Paenibacillus mucilaginosus TaxID=61624 RepID=UPI003D219194